MSKYLSCYKIYYFLLSFFIARYYIIFLYTFINGFFEFNIKVIKFIQYLRYHLNHIL